MNYRYYAFLSIAMLWISCEGPKSKVDIPSPKKAAYASDTLQLSPEVLYDKVLGALVGSAIGDAMGAPTEMWHRKNIQLKYGYVTDIEPVVRPESPEGSWAHHLMAGATTDDTRWKYLTAKYFSAFSTELTPENFAAFIVDYYQSQTKKLKDASISVAPDSLDVRIEKIDWIKEWARVAIAYGEGPKEYQKAQSRFYGGEMSCAGQLYTPMFGFVSKTPDDAYQLAYEHALFDIGYGRDIAALVSAMTHMALRTQNMDSILNVAAFVDPYGYQDSRLVGRISYGIAENAITNVLAIRQEVLVDSLLKKDAILFKVPDGFPGSKDEWVRQEKVYQLLEKDEKAIAFHAGEIWQILITGMQFGQGDFEKTLQFIVNYGRDNDTVAAIAGMILGARDGYSGLPDNLKKKVVQVNTENLGIDLEALAQELTAEITR
ncbi:MAG: ADP-ribosylglycohydrolase family protein [Bacteroidota bacterium]